MAKQWVTVANKTGLRYFKHETRKHGKQFDRYYSVRFRIDGKLYHYGIGWLSDGIPEKVRKQDPELGFEDYCLRLMREYKANVKSGSGAQSPKEKRKLEEARRLAEQEAEAKNAKENISFDDYIHHRYWPDKAGKIKPKTIKNEQMLYNLHIKNEIGILPMKDVNNDHIKNILAGMTKQAGRTKQYALQVIRQVYNHAKLNSPIEKSDWPKFDNAKRRFLSIEEADRLLEALAKHSQNLHDEAMMSLHCGLRFGEIASLTWNCINWSAGTIAILNAKTGSRTAYMTARVREMLQNRQMRNPKPDDLVFPAKTGKKAVQASKRFADVVDALGLNDGVTDGKMKITFHNLRHSFATHLFETTGDLYLTQKAMGHSTIAMTQRYSHMSDDRMRQGAQALEQRLNANREEAGQGKVVQFRR